MVMRSSLLELVILVSVVAADVSHLNSRYLPPNYHMPTQDHHLHNHQTVGIQMSRQYNQKPTNERVETTIEKHEVIELPTQIEIVDDGQPIYGVHPQPIEMARMSANKHKQVTEIRSRYLTPTQDIENLLPPQLPYEMPMRTYLPPVAPDTTTDMPLTTTTFLPPTTNSPTMDEETTTEQQTTTEGNLNSMTTTEIPVQDEQLYDTTTSSPDSETIPENRFLTLVSLMPRNQYLPPLAMMLPPLDSMPQLTYQQYQEQLLREQNTQEMQQIMEAIDQMKQQKMIALEPEKQQPQQPFAPVEPAHVLREDGYHYKTSNDNFLRYRFRY